MHKRKIPATRIAVLQEATWVGRAGKASTPLWYVSQKHQSIDYVIGQKLSAVVCSIVSFYCALPPEPRRYLVKTHWRRGWM